MTPRLETFEQAVAARALDECFGLALDILAAIDKGFGRLDAVAWRPSPLCATEEERLVEFATRFAAAFGALLCERSFDSGPEGFELFTPFYRWTDVLFRLSAFGSSNHLLPIIGASASGEQWCFEGSAPARFLAAWSPSANFTIDPAQWLDGQPRPAVAAFLGHLAARACLTPAAAAFRETLLDLTPARLDAAPLGAHLLARLADPYLHCSYAMGPDKHAIKAPLMRQMRRACLANGCREASTPPAHDPGRKPTIVVVAEFFAEGHSVHRTHARAVSGLRRFFHVVGVIPSGQRSPAVDACFDDMIEYGAGAFMPAVRAAADAILARQPDIVFHLGVGLSPLVIALASLRLAPVQCASFGHAATTMSPAIDHMVLPEDFVGSPACFSENLLLLPPGAFPYAPRRDVDMQAVRARVAALDDGVTRIAVPASLPKLNPNLFAAFRAVAEAARTAVEFHFFPLGAAGLAALDLSRALRAALPGAVAHPEARHPVYMERLAACDLFASPFPYGNMNSIVDAVGLGLPGVCLDGPELHAHADAAIFARLGLPTELVARDEAGYVAALVRLVNDEEWRATCRQIAADVDLETRFYAGDESLLGQRLIELIAGPI